MSLNKRTLCVKYDKVPSQHLNPGSNDACKRLFGAPALLVPLGLVHFTHMNMLFQLRYVKYHGNCTMIVRIIVKMKIKR